MNVYLTTARQVLRLEGEALLRLEKSIGEEVGRAIEKIVQCRGRVVVTGMGKAGLVGRKIAATLASTGMPSFFLHPAEAAHGDLGQVTADDLVIALSNSGSTAEVVRLLPSFKAAGLSMIALTARNDSPLGRAACVCIELGELDEACPIGLAPTTSSTVMLALGDALAMAAAQAKGTSKEDFARVHPGGNLGRSLLPISQLMRQGEELPTLQLPATLRHAVDVMGSTKGRPGCALIIDADGLLLGLFTDGDLRRLVAKERADLQRPIAELMTKNPLSLAPEDRLLDAETVLVTRSIDQAPVVDSKGKLVGLIDIQDLSGRG
ncbi:MAG: KpsF/GutQ family sugar-phosphate isomerase [Myxococcota bacterium]|nr:KpsF/GutQ family sugar-phosphate isomerase [Myxococcota bacterium]